MIEYRTFTHLQPETPDLYGQRRPIDKIFMDGGNHQIIYDDTIALEGYEIRPFRIMDQIGNADGCDFVTAPFKSTRTQHIIGDVGFTDAWEAGNGTFLAVNPEGKVVSIPSAYHSAGEMIRYTKGWTITWIAGENGLKVMSICRPPFQTDMEVEVELGATEVNGVVIPAEYWEQYSALKSPPQK